MTEIEAYEKTVEFVLTAIRGAAIVIVIGMLVALGVAVAADFNKKNKK